MQKFYSLFLLLISFHVYGQDTIYVDQNAANGGTAGTGASWADAYIFISDALQNRNDGDQIWIAAGNYKVAGTGSSIFSALRIEQENIKIYGGFAGGETSINQRDWLNNVVSVSGDLASNDANGSFSDNVLHVFMLLAENALIDGISISGGYAYGAANNGGNIGAAVYKIPEINNFTLRNCTIQDNAASDFAVVGGDFNNPSTASAVNILNCVFKNNSARNGGAIYLHSRKGERVFNIANSLFEGNFTVDGAFPGRAGSSLYIFADEVGYSTITNITNCTFVKNRDNGTNADYNQNNKSTVGVASLGGFHSVNINNCIFWGNKYDETNIAYGVSSLHLPYTNTSILTVGINNTTDELGFGSIVNDYFFLNALFDDDPQFTDFENGDYTLRGDSPLINAGINLFAVGTKDLAGLARIQEDIIDQGAYENISSPVVSTTDLQVNQAQKAYDIYPNPATEQVNVKGTKDFKKLQILDSFGRVLLETQSRYVGIESLRPNLYFVKVIDKQGAAYVEKLIVN